MDALGKGMVHSPWRDRVDGVRVPQNVAPFKTYESLFSWNSLFNVFGLQLTMEPESVESKTVNEGELLCSL